MLLSLSIRDVVLIEKLDLSFHAGLSVLTGETGAGKSILLDALGLALGARAVPGLVRRGAPQATVTAEFDLPPDHPARAILTENDRDDDGVLVLRRVLGADGKSRAFVNDQAASVGLLRQLGDNLVEIQGQAEQRGLADATTHRPLLDAYGGLDVQADMVASCWRSWRATRDALAAGQAALDKARTEEDFLRHAHAELEGLDPQVGEEQALTESRLLLRNQEQLVEALDAARTALSSPTDVEDAIGRAVRALEKVAPKAAGRLDPAVAALGRASSELADARACIDDVGMAADMDPARRGEIEDRYFALKDVARKHRVEVDALAALKEEMADTLAALADQGGAIAALEAEVARARDAYLTAAQGLSAGRRDAAHRLDKAMARELPPLRFGNAVFITRVEPLDEADWGVAGMDRVAFEAATNPGVPAGPIARVASGGELARFMLALKVVLARVGTAPTLVFDEVDSGIGGATAHAVGERLARLGSEVQVLVVTHSPQVAARGGYHWRVVKSDRRAGVVTSLDVLEGEDRREEIARMISGKQVTQEARAAAASLLLGERIEG